MSGGGATWGSRALGRGGFETSASSHTSRSLISTCWRYLVSGGRGRGCGGGRVLAGDACG